jgi:hypothetical protein
VPDGPVLSTKVELFIVALAKFAITAAALRLVILFL